MLDRLSQPEKRWATLFVRTRIPMLSANTEDVEDLEPALNDDEIDASDFERGQIGYHMRTYYNRVHVFDRRLLPLVKRLRPGDRVFVTGFLSYYKPTLTSSPPGVAEVRKIGAVVAERLVLLGSSDEAPNPATG